MLEAVGTARWRGTPLAPLLEEAGVPDGAVEVLFTGLDRGVEGGEEQAFQRALALDEARRDEVLLAYEMNGAPLPPQHGFPLRLVVPGWYGMTNVKWLVADRVARPSRSPATSNRQGYRLRQTEDDEGVPLHADAAALAARAAGDSGVHDPRAHGRGRRGARRGPCLVGPGADRVGRGQRRRRLDLGGRRARARRRAVGLARLSRIAGTRSPASTSSAHARATRPATSSRSSRPGTSAATRTTRCRRCASPSRLERQRDRREGEHQRQPDDQTSVERTPHDPSSFAFPVPPTVGGAADGGIPQPGGLSTANWSVISSRRERKR